jgi:hypothetical protein
MQQRGTTILFVSHEPTLVRALCSRAILLYQGELLADGAPVDVLNRYQRLIMAREEAYKLAEHGTDASSQAREASNDQPVARSPLQCQYRHGNNFAEVIDAQLLNTDGEPIELVDSGDPVNLRMRFVIHQDLPQVVCGFMIRNRHGINIYGTNTEQRGLDLGKAQRGDVIEATFAFNCALGQEHYFISVAVHSPDGVAFDWLDGVIFFRVACPVEMEGIANLNARVTARTVSEELVKA